MHELIDLLTYRSWKHQIELYGMTFLQLRKLFPTWKEFEKLYKEERKEKSYE